MIKEAQKPAVREWSDTAWIYNGFDDIELYHVGRPYLLKQGELTKIEGRPEYREIDQTKSSGSEIVWQNLPMKGEFIAGELIYEHGFHQMGFTVLTTDKISNEEKRRCDDTGKQYKLKRIEEFKVHRDKARAGIVGYKINPDPTVYRWMQQYAPDDAMFAEQATRTDSSKSVAEAISLLTRLMIANGIGNSTNMAVTANPAPVPEPQTVEAPHPGGMPRRKPLETNESFRARMEVYKKAVEAAAAPEHAEAAKE